MCRVRTHLPIGNQVHFLDGDLLTTYIACHGVRKILIFLWPRYLHATALYSLNIACIIYCVRRKISLPHCTGKSQTNLTGVVPHKLMIYAFMPPPPPPPPFEDLATGPVSGGGRDAYIALIGMLWVVGVDGEDSWLMGGELLTKTKANQEAVLMVFLK